MTGFYRTNITAKQRRQNKSRVDKIAEKRTQKEAIINPTEIQKGSWAAAVYNDEWYPGKIKNKPCTFKIFSFLLFVLIYSNFDNYPGIIMIN